MEMVALDPMVAKIDTVVPNLVFDMNCLTKAKLAGKNVTKLVEIALGAATWAPAADMDIMMEMVALDPMVAKIDTVVPNLVFDMNCLTKANFAGKHVTKLVEIAIGAATWAPAANWEGKGKWKMEIAIGAATWAPAANWEGKG